MNVGLQIIEKLVRGEGNFEQALEVEQVFNLAYPHDPNWLPWQYLKAHYAKHGKLPSEELFRQNFPEESYKWAHFSKESFAELTEAARNQIATVDLSGLLFDLIACDEAKDYDKAYRLIADFQGRPVAASSSWSRWNPDEWLSGEPEELSMLGYRDDDVPLLYAGKTHSVVAETEAGKTWLALLWCAQEIEAGHDVGFIDFEDDGPGIYLRLLNLVDENLVVKHFIYVRPEEPLPGPSALKMFGNCSLVIVDGIGEALSLHGLKSDDEGVLKLNGILMRPVSFLGPAVVSLDHLPKDKNNQDNAFGSVYKGNQISGASFILRNVESFGLGRTGYSKLYVRKDRPATIRKECVVDGPRMIAAELHMISDDPDRATVVKLKAPSIRAGKNLILYGRLSDFVFSPEYVPMSTDKLASSVQGKASELKQAIKEMVEQGFFANTGTDTRSKIEGIQRWSPGF